MHYPWWSVPALTAPLLIAIVAVLHVLVSHYAVGGGLFLAVEIGRAYRAGDEALLRYLRSHAWFFVLLTVVFGAITGVGIWWTIGLASPLATEVLIHTFLFGWAIEYVFFVIEIAAAFALSYGWGRLPPRVHQTVGWLYAIAAWISLVLITAITGFMLNPGRWATTGGFWTAVFNPQFVPQVLARTGGALLLASLYVYLHAAVKAPPELRTLLGARSARPALLGALLVLSGGALWYLFLPASARAALEAASTLNLLMLLIFALTAVVFIMLYLGPYRNPGWVTTGFAILFFVLGATAFTAGEFIREAVRKPYVIYNVVLSNGIYPPEVPRLRAVGFLEGGTWTRAYVAARWPALLDRAGRIAPARLRDLPAAERVEVGRVLFQYHCNACHAVAGYSGMRALTRGWSRPMLRDLVEHPERVRFFMPPWAGTPEEAEALADYLAAVAPPPPPGMRYDGAGGGP